MSAGDGRGSSYDGEARYRALFEHARDAILIADDRARYVDANPSACELLGYSRDELIQLTVWDVIPAESVSEGQALWREFIAGGHLRGETVMVRKDGTRVPVAFNSVANVLPGVHVTINRDLTESAHAAELLRLSEQRYQTLLGNAPLIFFAVDPDGRFTLAEGLGLVALDFERGDLVGESAIDTFGDVELRQRSGIVTSVRAAIARVMKGETVNGLTTLKGRYFENSFVPMRGPDGSVSGMMGVAFDVTDLERSAEALRDSEEHVRTVLEHISDVITVLAPDATILYESPSVTRVLGYEPSELVGRNALHFVHPDDRAKVAHAFNPGAGESVMEQFRFRHRDGAWLTLEALGKARTAADGSLTAVVASRDVTERERATAESRLLKEVTLRVAEARDTDAALAAVMRLVCETIEWEYAEAWVPSSDGSVLEASSAWFCTGAQLEPFRQASADCRFAAGVGLPGRAWFARTPVWITGLASHPGFGRSEAARAVGLRTGLAIPIAADDPEAPVLAVVAFYSLHDLDEDPRLDNLLTAVMTQLGSGVQRKQAEVALRSSQKLLQSVVTSAPVIVFALDRDGNFTLSEGRGLAALGLQPGQMVGASALAAYSEVPDVVAHLRRALAGETFIGTADVAGRSYQTWYSPIVGADGGVAGVVGVATDITERKELEDQLRQSQRLESVGRLAGGIAHDFNNMLTAITGYAELILERLPPSEPMREEAMEIKRAADQATLLTYQLLAFSRKQILRPKTLNLNDVVADVSRMLQRLIGEDIMVETRLAPDLGAVSADPGQIAQVIINLSVNARDAMPQGGVLTIETANAELDSGYADTHVDVPSGSFVMLAVSDTGTGMSAEVQKRIFEPFFTTKGVGKGTGMGLATVYGIVKQSGGHLWVYSEVGEGSSFKIYLPRVPGADTRPEAGLSDPAMSRGVETILLVEDEAMVRHLVRRALEGCGYVVLEAPDGEAALEICGKEGTSIALVITDVVMPKMSGRELIEQLSISHPSLRVLYISGYTDSDVVHHGGLEDVTYFLQKPFTMRALTAKVREILDA